MHIKTIKKNIRIIAVTRSLTNTGTVTSVAASLQNNKRKLFRISLGLEWWNGILELKTGMEYWLTPK